MSDTVYVTSTVCAARTGRSARWFQRLASAGNYKHNCQHTPLIDHGSRVPVVPAAMATSSKVFLHLF